MNREQAINWIQNKILPRIYNPKDEDKQALEIALHDMKVINNFDKGEENNG